MHWTLLCTFNRSTCTRMPVSTIISNSLFLLFLCNETSTQSFVAVRIRKFLWINIYCQTGSLATRWISYISCLHFFLIHIHAMEASLHTWLSLSPDNVNINKGVDFDFIDWPKKSQILIFFPFKTDFFIMRLELVYPSGKTFVLFVIWAEAVRTIQMTYVQNLTCFCCFPG